MCEQILSMRYVLLDRITHLERGRSLRGVKNVSVSDDLVTRYGQGVHALPSSMVLEAMAQAAGLLIAGTQDCRCHPVLAKIQPFAISGLARPGDRLDVVADLVELRDEGCEVAVSASIDHRVIASATVYLGLVAHSGADADGRTAEWRRFLADTFPECFGAQVAERAS
jgi:3-hydroxymyristoyl/3-hydroxydecanoyl-(acyl carrier protein) dehydratase